MKCAAKNAENNLQTSPTTCILKDAFQISLFFVPHQAFNSGVK